MSREHLSAQGRRVVIGVNDAGMSFIESDSNVRATLATEAFTINQIWQVDTLPPNTLAIDTTTDQVSIAPPLGGFNYLVTTFPPDNEWDLKSGYKEALARIFHRMAVGSPGPVFDVPAG